VGKNEEGLRLGALPFNHKLSFEPGRKVRALASHHRGGLMPSQDPDQLCLAGR
jgi:hypothetical protein